MVKQPAMEASEFTMSNEDFPALPAPGPNQGQSAPAAPAPSSMDDISAASAGSLPNQLGQPQGVIGNALSSDMMLQSTQGKTNLIMIYRQITLRIVGCSFCVQLTDPLYLCLI